MKLSAPPPPPPEPPEPPAPAPDGDPAAGPTPPPAPEPPADSKPVAQPATWPQWFATADAVLAALAVGLAFLVASFAARNSDLWLHLATGKRLVSGEYRFGSDPFSYSAADRVWVNHSWLWDLGAYLLYGGTGFALVFLKAVAVAVAFGLLLAIRRPSSSLWPWVLCAVLAALASAPRLTLGPQIASFLFLAVTMFLVFRLPSPPGSWRLPAAVGVTFWLWANCDQWFILGPLAVGLLLAGELIQQKVLKKPEEADDAPGKLPDVPTLARALLVGIVACVLNPHHVRVWALPIDLTGSEVASADPALGRLLFPSVLDSTYRENARLGYNQNGLAYAVLLVGGVWVLLAGALGWGGGRARVSHLFLGLAFALLSLWTVAVIPFFAVVAVPLVAVQVNSFTARAALGTKAEPRTRLLLTAGTAGRVLGVLALVGLCAAAWPGWLHPTQDSPADAPRVAWAVEPDPAMVRVAEQVGKWREDGKLPADARGMSTSVGLANYVAWYAPREKVFLNSRYTHHRQELAGLLALRAALGLRAGEDGPDPEAVGRVLEKYRASYLTVYDRFPRFGPGRVTDRLAADWSHWAPWYTDGRTQVLGWRESPAKAPPWFDRMRIDPAALAFGPTVARLPAGKAEPVPPPRTWADEFTRPPLPSPAAADEVLGWVEYKAAVMRGNEFRQNFGRMVMYATPLPQGASHHELMMQFALLTNQVPPARVADLGDVLAPPVLAVRAARRAIAANPDHPDGYFALARALADPNLPMNDSERNVAMVTAYRQCLSRMPTPDEYRAVTERYNRRAFGAMPTQVAIELAQLYLGQNPQDGRFLGTLVNVFPLSVLVGDVSFEGGRRQQVPFLLSLDLAREALVLAVQYADVELAGAADPEMRKRYTDQLKAQQKGVEERLRVERGRYEQQAEAAGKLSNRFFIARRHHLTGEAIKVLKSNEVDLAKEFGANAAEVALQLVALELCVGRLEDAARDIADLKDALAERAAKGDADPRLAEHRSLLRYMEMQKMLLEGDYAAAGAALEDLEGGSLGVSRMLEELTKMGFDPRPYGTLQGQWPVVPMLGATSPLAAFALFGAGSLQLNKYGYIRNQLGQRLAADAEFYFRRGFLSLLEGDMEAAKARFHQATDRAAPPPPGWNLPPARHGLAAEYLQLIEAAERKQ